MSKRAKRAWDESKHPRHPRGSEQGGEFAPKDGTLARFVYDKVMSGGTQRIVSGYGTSVTMQTIKQLMKSGLEVVRGDSVELHGRTAQNWFVGRKKR